jgi:hypothetical protein
VTRDSQSGTFAVNLIDEPKWLRNSFLGRTARLNDLLIATAVLVPVSN